MSANGGITKGKSHKEGGIPMVVKSTGQQVELEGGEGVINKRNMASDKKFEFQGKQMTTCEIASEINSANGNGVQIECDNVTGKKYEYSTGGKILNEDEEESFKEWMDDGNVIEQSKGVYSTQDAQYRNRLKGLDELRKYFRKEFLSDSYEGGGGVGNVYIALSKTKNGLLLSERFDKQITHQQLFDYYKKRGYEIIDSNIFKVTNKDVLDVYKDAISKFIEEKYNELVDWENTFLSYEIVGDRIIAQSCFVQTQNGKEYKITPNDLVNKKFAEGGGVKEYKSLIGKYVNIYSMGVSLPTEHQIKDVQVSGDNFRYRYVTLKFDLGIAPILLDEATAFMNNEIIYVNNNKEEFGIQLIPNQYAEGGNVPKANKMFHLPLELAVYVPSTQDVDKVISDSELDARVNEVSKYLARIFGGFTKSDKVGGFMSLQSELVTEEVVPVVSFATKEDYEANKNKLVTKLSEWARKWGQEAIGFEFEGDLYYVPQKFEGGGDVRNFDWYQQFKKQELKRGTKHEMEHIDTIREFKKEDVSDEEVAEAIAKDHLEEDENYYIELDKMESSRKLSEALNDFTKQKGHRKNSRKYNIGGSTMDSKEIVHLKFNKDFNGVIRKKDGRYMSESFFPKGKVYKFTFLFNDGRTTALEFGNTGAYILAPNDIINIVGFNEKMYGNGGSVKPYQSMGLTENDKSIMKLLTKYSTPSSFNSRERQKLATFRGSNVVNELSSSLIQKIYGLLFANHKVENPIKELFLSNVGAGSIVSYSPKYIHKLMISFDDANQFVEIEKEINSILNEDKKYVLFNNMDIKTSDAIIHVYPNGNPEFEELNSLLYKTEKASIGLGICEFTSMDRMNKFKTQVSVNQGSFSQNQMMLYQQNTKYINVNEGITDEGQFTLIYILHKMS